MVTKPLWVLTGSVTGAAVSAGVTTTGMAVVAGGRVGSTVGSGRVGKTVGGCTRGVVATVGSDSVGHGPFTL